MTTRKTISQVNTINLKTPNFMLYDNYFDFSHTIKVKQDKSNIK